MEMLAANSGIILFLVLGFGIFMAWGMGANDVANAVGTSAAVVQTVQDGGAVAAKSGICWWVFLIGGAGIVLGLATYCSWRVTLPIAVVLPISVYFPLNALLG